MDEELEIESVSIYRSENKYLLNAVQAKQIQDKFDIILKPDPIQGNQFYKVRSLYFDSINNIDLNTKLAGVEIRKKIRLRVYDPEDKTVKLEMKQKNGDLSHKISLNITREDAKELIECNYGILTKYFNNPDAILFFTTMQIGCYRPVTMIEYDRKAYTYPVFDTRLTFDTNIRETESNFDLFDRNPVYTYVMNEEILLEVKYNEELVSFISDILKPYHLNRIALSKYVSGRKIFYEFNY